MHLATIDMVTSDVIFCSRISASNISKMFLVGYGSTQAHGTGTRF